MSDNNENIQLHIECPKLHRLIAVLGERCRYRDINGKICNELTNGYDCHFCIKHCPCTYTKANVKSSLKK